MPSEYENRMNSIRIRFVSRVAAAESSLLALVGTPGFGYIAPPESGAAMIYPALSRLFSQRVQLRQPRRIVFIRSCCIGRRGDGDSRLERGAPSLSCGAYHFCHRAPGPRPPSPITPPSTPSSIPATPPCPGARPPTCCNSAGSCVKASSTWALSLTRSPLMSLALWLSRIPVRVGLDSGGRGFGYNLRRDRRCEGARARSGDFLARRVCGGGAAMCITGRTCRSTPMPGQLSKSG